MRRSLAIAALLASTCLTPCKAAAGPLVPFFYGLSAALSGSAAAAATASILGGAYASGLAVGTFLTGALGRVVLSVGLSYLSQRLGRTKTAPPSSRMGNFAEAVSYQEFVLGMVRKGGPTGFQGRSSITDPVSGTSGRKRHYSPILAAHPIDGIETHYIGEAEVSLDADGLVTTEPLDGFYRVRPFLGQAGQVADEALVASFPEVTSSFDFAGLAGAHIWSLRANDEDLPDVYPQGRPAAYAPVLRGFNLVYDPRDDTLKFTRNAALCLAAFFVDYLGFDYTAADWADVAIEADACDVLVEKRGGAMIPAWRLDAILSDEQDYEDQRANLGIACDALFFEKPNGNPGFFVGRWIPPTVVLTERDCLSLEWAEGTSGSGRVSEVACRYIEPANGWREAVSGAYVVDEDGRQNREEPEIYAISDHNQAFRVNIRIAKVKTATATLRATLKPRGQLLRCERFFQFSHAVFGDHYMEIGELARNGHLWEVTATTVLPEDFDQAVADIEPEPPAFAKIVSDDTVPDLTGFTGEAQAGGAVKYRWTLPGDDSLQRQVRTRETGTDDWIVIDVPSTQSFQVVSGLAETVAYEAQGRNRTPSGRVSTNWSPSPVNLTTVRASSVAPAAVASFSVTVTMSDATADITASSDANHAGTRIYRATDSTDFANAALQRTEYHSPSSTASWDDAALAPGPYSYWAEPVNNAGKPGPKTGPVTITVT